MVLRFKILLISGLSVFFLACGNSNCKKDNVEGWDEFVNIPYKGNELKLEDYLGNFTGGEYASDSSAFVYYFKRVQRAPISVWVNALTGDVETVFVEILGYEDYFEEDVDNLQKEFDLDDCEVKYFGMQASDLIAIFGKADKDEQSDDGARSLTYNSEDYKIVLNFKCYDSQGGKCSAISLNWFY